MAKHDKNTVRKKSKALLILSLFSVLSIGSISTMAAYSSQATTAVAVSAGSINLTAGGSASSTLDFGTGWKPGQTAYKDLIIKNAGTLPMKYTVPLPVSPGALSKKLTVTAKIGTVSLYSGTLEKFTIASRALAAGGSETIRITLTWTASTTDNTYQGTSGATKLVFNGAL